MGFEGLHAEHYDRLYAWRDLEPPARALVALMREAGLPPEPRVLEAACGTGAWLEALLPEARVAGFDLSPAMVRLARRRLPGVPVWRADLRELVVDRPYDAAICMFSSIGYLDADDLVLALGRLRAATRPGGLVVVEPWLTPESFVPGRCQALQHQGPGLCVTRHARTSREGRISNLDFALLVTTPEGTTFHEERHRLWLHTREELAEAFEAAGLAPAWIDEGGPWPRGLWLGRHLA